ncbi:MAG: Wadjet anti-phage system protein JetD domain-containing protein [Ferruginibacter sp.]
MISPQEIKAQALKWWKPFLQSHLRGEVFFPRNIDRIGKIRSSSVRENINELQTKLDELYKNEKEKLGFGYIVNKEDVRFRRTGSHSLPQSITFESLEDYVAFIGKKKEWYSFVESNNLIQTQLPQLKEWVINNPLVVIENKHKWINLIQVCKYFLLNPRPNLYIRQLPIDLHTKFIEHNEVVIRSLLDFLIPDSIQNIYERSFSKRYSLKYDQPTVRIRILDEQLKLGTLTDLSLPLSDFEQLNFNCEHVVLTENKMTFLALPNLKSTMAVWSGGGFMISYLRNVQWLHEKKITYWGDLDSHGFVMLHQMRTYFPQTESAMMDMETFELFKGEGLVPGEKTNATNLNTLTEKEIEVFNFLKSNNFRLEQEKIRQDYADRLFRKLYH